MHVQMHDLPPATRLGRCTGANNVCQVQVTHRVRGLLRAMLHSVLSWTRGRLCQLAPESVKAEGPSFAPRRPVSHGALNSVPQALLENMVSERVWPPGALRPTRLQMCMTKFCTGEMWWVPVCLLADSVLLESSETFKKMLTVTPQLWTDKRTPRLSHTGGKLCAVTQAVALTQSITWHLRSMWREDATCHHRPH